MSVDAHKETLGFQTEVKQLLNLMIHSLYSNKEIFLRELVSNAADAADKLRFEALSDDALYEDDAELKIRVEFDKDKISYREILEIFFALHNPTQVDRQGNDVGPQYRSAIFFHSEAQKLEALKIIAEINEEQIWPDPVVTEVTEINNYYPAEDYHQNYFKNNPQNQYCAMVVAPKLAKFKKTFAERLR